MFDAILFCIKDAAMPSYGSLSRPSAIYSSERNRKESLEPLRESYHHQKTRYDKPFPFVHKTLWYCQYPGRFKKVPIPAQQ